jgi:hypothetical protein
MKRFTSSRRFGMPLALLLGATAVCTTLVSTAAWADWQKGPEWNDSTYGHVTIWVQKDASGQTKLAIEVDKGGKTLISFSGAVIDYLTNKQGGDPGPDDDTRTQSEPINVAGLIEKGLITIKVKVTPENTKLAKWIEQGGGGFVPHWNPGDDDNKGPSTPPRNNAENGPTLTQKQLDAYAKLMNRLTAELKQIGTSMGDVGDLGSESAPGLPTNKNGNGSSTKNNGPGNGADNKSGQRKFLGTDLSLGPRPDLVNPPHSNSRGAKTNLFSPGLLETGGGLSSSNGPSAVGTPLGGIGSRGGSGANIR